jgi:hypothetical protein
MRLEPPAASLDAGAAPAGRRSPLKPALPPPRDGSEAEVQQLNRAQLGDQ